MDELNFTGSIFLGAYFTIQKRGLPIISTSRVYVRFISETMIRFLFNIFIKSF